MRIIKYFLIITIPPLIILANFTCLVLNASYYQNLQQKSGVYTKFEDENIVNKQTKDLVGYFRGKNQLDHNFFSNQAILHLNDVKNLLNTAFGMLTILGVTVFLLSGILIFKKEYDLAFQAVFVSSSATIFSLILVSLGALNFFDKFFISFHKLFFTNDLWLFEESDNLIKLFPQEFFILFSKTLFVNTIITSIVLLSLSIVFNKKYVSK